MRASLTSFFPFSSSFFFFYFFYFLATKFFLKFRAITAFAFAGFLTKLLQRLIQKSYTTKNQNASQNVILLKYNTSQQQKYYWTNNNITQSMEYIDRKIG